MTSRLKRIVTDAGGYFLILLGIASGWLPGPGGIPLVLGGLGLLSINNMWARRLRDWLLAHGGDFIKWIFPKHPAVQWLYDFIAVGLLGVVAYLAHRRAAIWQLSLAIALFFIAMLIIGINRDRASRIKKRVRHQPPQTNRKS
jgi:hypothetical protein